METKLTKEGDINILAIQGRVDTVTSTELDKQMRIFYTETNVSIRIDMSETTYISSSGLRCFISLLMAIKPNGGKIEIVNMKPEIKEIFNLTGFSSLFEIK